MKPEALAQPDRTAPGAAIPADGETRDGHPRALGSGGLPARRPDSVWGGPGAGACCTICGAHLSDDEMELEIEFAREDVGADKYHVHVSCFAAWEADLRKAEAARLRSVLPGNGEKRQNGARDDVSFRRGRP